VLRLHRLLNNAQQLGRQGVQVGLVARRGGKRGQRLLGVVLAAEEPYAG
jgi:hypothetical protein